MEEQMEGFELIAKAAAFLGAGVLELVRVL